MADSLPDAHLRGPPTSTKQVLVAAKPSLERSGYLLRLVMQDIAANQSVVIIDFGSGESEFLACCSQSGRVAIVDAVAREYIPSFST